MRRSVCVAVATPSCCIAQCKGIRISESGKILLVESGILGFGIRYTANGIRNPSNDCNLDQNPSYTDKKNTVPGNRNSRGGIQNPSLSRISLHGVSCN